MIVDIADAALLEMEEGALYYEMQAEGLGARFSSAARLAIEEVGGSPLLAREIEPGIRKWNLQKFPYTVIFRLWPSGNGLTVVAVMHAHREPGYWRARG